MTCKQCQAYEAELADYAQTVTKLRRELAECRNHSKRTDMKVLNKQIGKDGRYTRLWDCNTVMDLDSGKYIRSIYCCERQISQLTERIEAWREYWKRSVEGEI